MTKPSAARRHLAWLIVPLITTCLSLVSSQAVAQTPLSAFTVDSEFGDYVGKGETAALSTSNAQITAVGDPFSVQMDAQGGNHHFHAVVQAPTGQLLTAGTFQTTQQADTAHAGLDVSVEGRHCANNWAEGTLTVHEATFFGATLQSFAASYEQRCSGGAFALYGELRYNSSVAYVAAAAPKGLAYDMLPGQTDQTQAVTVESLGSASLRVLNMSIQGFDASRFKISAESCAGAPVQPGSSCTLDVNYTPQGNSSARATLMISDSTRRGGRAVDLQGGPYKPTPQPPPPPPGPGGQEPVPVLIPTTTHTKLLGHYAKQGKYQLFHEGAGVLQISWIVPEEADSRLTFAIERKRGKTWKLVALDFFRVGKRGVAVAGFSGPRGRYRANNEGGDGEETYALSISDWQYFKITR